ncbi:DUF7345 domain-containing protein [Haloglomus halophilum]|uniref:DUF7345 domain-containing protein n=1 Tax=Haloglomus halophilum TaxID=2962672 RepID=UPI0020CA1192|nr:hypothetical protein [Haloglomus halophilum]
MDRYRGSTVLALLVVALLATVAGGSLSPNPGGSTTDSVPAVQRNASGLAADTTAIRIAVQPDGSAVWEVGYRVALDDEETRSRFETVDDRIEARPLQYTGPYREMMAEAAEVAASRTGRSMEIRNVTVQARELPTGEGVVVYRFVWTGFASRSGGRMVIGDAITRLPLSDADTRLVVQWPAGFDAKQVSPDPDTRRDRAVVWRGPVEFAPYEPRVTVGGGPLLGPDTLATIGAVVGLVAATGAGGVGVYWWRRRDPDGRLLPWPSSEDRTGTTPDDPSTADDPATAAEESATEEPSGDGDGAAAAVPEELLSDPERVLDLLESRGGRMKQQEVVSELGWSETKTSQVVNEMQDEGTIEVYRIGRENVLSLPGEMDV